MLNSMDQSITRLTLADPVELDLSRRTNFTLYLTEAEVDDVSRVADPDYEQFLADVWVGIVLTLMVLSCVCCMCSCLLYHKFQQWKRNILEARRRSNNVESGQSNDTESLPSYTIVSGLPSYDEAIEQLRKVRNQSKEDLSTETKTTEPWVPHTPPPPMTRLSVSELFQLYKNSNTTQSTVECKT